MKTKNLIHSALALTLSVAGGTALAQSSVTLYGIVDAAVERASNGAGVKVNRLVSGQGSASRLGFRGTEDLGGGLRAIFNLEAAINTDNGTAAAWAEA